MARGNARELEKRLVRALVEGDYKIGGPLPLEKDLAQSMGVSRTTLREVLKRLESYGFIITKRGSPSRVRDFWREGNLLILAKIAEHVPQIPSRYVTHLLEVRLGLMPLLVGKAVEEAPEELVAYLVGYQSLSPSHSQGFVEFDWGLHKRVAELSDNPVALMLVNSFESVYMTVGGLYFALEEARWKSLKFYKALLEAAMDRNGQRAREVTERAMEESLALWKEGDK